LNYLREYWTRESIGADYEACKGRVSGTVKWVEDTLKKVPDFKVPGKEALKGEETSLQ
jgi:hypothetical protein